MNNSNSGISSFLWYWNLFSSGKPQHLGGIFYQIIPIPDSQNYATLPTLPIKKLVIRGEILVNSSIVFDDKSKKVEKYISPGIQPF